MNKQIKWINCAKFIAILAVMIDHTSGILYTNEKIVLASYFSVSLFIIISGMTSWISYEKNNKNMIKKLSILFDYCIATFVYLLCEKHFFDFKQYIKLLINFNVTGPFYFVLLYVQLTLVSGIIFNYLHKERSTKKQIIYDILGLLGVICISYFTTNYTNILNIYGGGGKILGGTYLILYYIGMLIMKYNFFDDKSIMKSSFFTIVFGGGWFVWWFFIICYDRKMIDGLFPFGEGINPPSICLMISAICMLGFLFGLFTLLQRFWLTEWIVSVMAVIGKYTLYVFLYHRFFLDFLLTKYVILNNIWMVRVIYLSVMIIGSIAFNLVKNKILEMIGD